MQLATLDKLEYGLLRTCTDTYGQLGIARGLRGFGLYCLTACGGCFAVLSRRSLGEDGWIMSGYDPMRDFFYFTRSKESATLR